jgi:chorismate lyase/3-hydroxybenzoate synthase
MTRSTPLVTDAGIPEPFARLSPLEPVPPQWVLNALGPHPAAIEAVPGVHGVASDDLLLVHTTIPGAVQLTADAFGTHVSNAYDRLNTTLATTGFAPIRFWNFIPDLGATMAPGIDRYMAFNAGRHDAFSAAQRRRQPLTQSLATASAIGIVSDDLTIYCLASRTAGQPIENPRQRSSWTYSNRYGPLPPFFSRATVATFRGRRHLLIGGTASIVGEDSTHPGNAAGQVTETLRNLASVVAVATNAPEPVPGLLDNLVDVRVYVRSDDDAACIQREVRDQLRRTPRIEFMRAGICRPELLVEIEALASLAVLARVT